MIAEVGQKFNQSGLNSLEILENIILHAVKEKPSPKEELNKLLWLQFCYPQTIWWATTFARNGWQILYEIDFGYKKFKCESETARNFLYEVVRLIALNNSSIYAERSFSLLRSLKTNLRTTISQKWLTHIEVLCEHSHRTSQIDFNFIMNEFVLRLLKKKWSLEIFKIKISNM